MLDQLQLSSFGLFHTLLGIVALISGIVLLARNKEINSQTRLGQNYLWFTVLTCLTGFFIFRHGGFGPAHALGILTLLTLAVAALAERRRFFGRYSPHVAIVSYSATFFFHLIPTVVETTTRLPVGNPVITEREGPAIQAINGVLFIAFLIGVTWQVRRFKSARRLQRETLLSRA